MRRPCLPILLVALVLPAFAAVDPGFFGVCEHVNDAGGVFLSRNRVYNLCNRAGITWLRVDFPWAEIEPSRGTWQWDKFDAIVADAEAHGIQILPILDYGSAYGGHPQLVSDDMDGWLAYVRAVLTRYDGRFQAVEVWNEPDYSVFWSGTAAQFATLVQRTYAAVKAVDSSVTVVLGGLTNNGWDYLSSLYDAGVRDYCDVVAIHPYCHPMAPDADYEDKSYYKSRSGNWLTGYSYTYYGQLEYRIRRFRDVMSANGDGAKPVWITEHGWPTHTAGGVSEADQATYLAKALDIAVACGVEKYFVYNLIAFEGDLANGEHCFGIVHRDFTAKPAYTALQSKIASLTGAAADPYADHVWLTFGDYTDGATVSWASRGFWSDGAAPSADKDYLVDIGPGSDCRLLSTIQDHAETTFAGRSLTLGRAGGRAGYFSHEGWGSTVTVSRLVLGGGLATAGGGTGDGGQWLRGAVTVASPASAPFTFESVTNYPWARDYTIDATLAGASGTALRGLCRATAPGGASLDLRIAGNASAYAGGYIAEGPFTTLRLGAASMAGPSGAGPVTLRKGAALAPLADRQIFESARALVAEGGTARIDVPAGQTFTLSAPIVGTFRKTGAGTLVIDGGTTGSGRVVAGEGTVAVDLDTAQFVSGIDGGRVVYCVPEGSLSSAESIATITVPGPLSDGDVAVSDNAAALGWTTSVHFEEDPTSPGDFTAYVDVTASPRTVVGTDSFEAFASGTEASALPGWTGVGAVADGTPAVGDPPGVPLPAETHTRVLAISDEALRTYPDSFARDNQSVDMLLQATRQDGDDWQERLADDGALQLRLAFGPDGAPWLLHADAVTGTPVWTRLGWSLAAGAPSPAYENGAWLRVSIDCDYTASATATYAQVRLDGHCMLAPGGVRSPANPVLGGSWFRMLDPASSARSIFAIDFEGATAVDDLVLACHAPGLAPDFAAGSAASVSGIPFAWFDAQGIPRDPKGDPDGDGFDNAAERTAGTDPLDDASHPPHPTLLFVL